MQATTYARGRKNNKRFLRGINAVKALVSNIIAMEQLADTNSAWIASNVDNIARPTKEQTAVYVNMNVTAPAKRAGIALAHMIRSFKLLSHYQSAIDRKTALAAYHSEFWAYIRSSQHYEQEKAVRRLHVYRLFIPETMIQIIQKEATDSYNIQSARQVGLNEQQYDYSPNQTNALNWLSANLDKRINASYEEYQQGRNHQFGQFGAGWTPGAPRHGPTLNSNKRQRVDGDAVGAFL